MLVISYHWSLLSFLYFILPTRLFCISCTVHLSVHKELSLCFWPLVYTHTIEALLHCSNCSFQKQRANNKADFLVYKVRFNDLVLFKVCLRLIRNRLYARLFCDLSSVLFKRKNWFDICNDECVVVLWCYFGSACLRWLSVW